MCGDTELEKITDILSRKKEGLPKWEGDSDIEKESSTIHQKKSPEEFVSKFEDFDLKMGCNLEEDDEEEGVFRRDVFKTDYPKYYPEDLLKGKIKKKYAESMRWIIEHPLSLLCDIPVDLIQEWLKDEDLLYSVFIIGTIQDYKVLSDREDWEGLSLCEIGEYFASWKEGIKLLDFFHKGILKLQNLEWVSTFHQHPITEDIIITPNLENFGIVLDSRPKSEIEEFGYIY